MVYRDGSCSSCPPCLWRKTMKDWTSKEVRESKEVDISPTDAWYKINMAGDKNKEDYRWIIVGNFENTTLAVYTWKKRDE